MRAAAPVVAPVLLSMADITATPATGREPVFVEVYGGPGLGKSTFAAGAESPYFVPADPNGLRSLPKSIPRSNTPSTWDALMAIVRFFRDGQHDRKSLVLDTVNAIESLLFAHVCRQHGVSSIELVLKGYGKGYTIAAERMQEFVLQLHDLRTQRGMNIIAICHAKSKVQQDPSLPEHDLWTMALNDKIASVWIGAADTVLFAQAQATTRQEGEGFRERTKIEHTGRVLAHVRPGLGWIAKNRDFLRSPLALSWAVFEQAMNEGAELREALFAKLASLSTEDRAAAEMRLAGEGWSRESVENEINQ